MNKYPHLFSPIMIGGQQFKNRIFNSPTGVAIEPERYCVGYYERKAIGGAASVCIGDGCPNIAGRARKSQINLWDPTYRQSMADLAHSITRHGAVASMEILDAGNCSFYSNGVLGYDLYGPVEGISSTGAPIKMMDEDKIMEVIEQHARAALYCKNCGFNMVTIHGGHGWLITQFLSGENTRNDKWGGSIENRARLANAIIDRIHQVCGRSFPVEIRIVGDEVYDGGYNIEFGIDVAKQLEGHADLIHVSTGSHEVLDVFTVTHPSMFLPDGCNVKYAAEIKKHIKDTPIATVGALSDPEQLEEIIATGQADVVELARGLICDPDLPVKLMTGRDDEVRQCMRCLYCFSKHMHSDVINCAINPEIGHEYELNNNQIAQPKVLKKVLIAGGGMAGMQAALEASERGHEVILCEKSDSLGGALRCEKKVPFKEKLDRYIELQKHLIEKDGRIDVRLNTEVTPELAREIKPDVILAALGSRPVKPKIPGIDGPNVFGAEEIYYHPEKAGKNVAILGGGLVGMELAIFLSMLGSKCTVIEMLPDLNAGGNNLHALAIHGQLKKYGIHATTGTKALEITDKGVLCEYLGTKPNDKFMYDMPKYYPDAESGTHLYEADTVIYAVGQRPLREESDALRECAPEYYSIGDCIVPKDIWTATTNAYYIARDLGRY
ncbi:MAG: FAD-dependent oxidoreductase [Lachnospiraceae bacterium]|nr:FAD-dependent oxidoreductase [Lachnospiraceae bacterium]